MWASLLDIQVRRGICRLCAHASRTARPQFARHAGLTTHSVCQFKANQPINIAALTVEAEATCPAEQWGPVQPGTSTADARQEVCVRCRHYHPIAEACALCEKAGCLRKRQRDPGAHCPRLLW